jgi:hypothetical protein
MSSTPENTSDDWFCISQKVLVKLVNRRYEHNDTRIFSDHESLRSFLKGVYKGIEKRHPYLTTLDAIRFSVVLSIMVGDHEMVIQLKDLGSPAKVGYLHAMEFFQHEYEGIERDRVALGIDSEEATSFPQSLEFAPNAVPTEDAARD